MPNFKKLLIIVEDKEDWKSDWISLEERYEEDVLELKERIEGLHSFRYLMCPERKEYGDAAIMSEVGAFRSGFTTNDSAFRNLTKSALSKILRNLLSCGLDHRFVIGNVKFLTKLFDIAAVREQVRAYLTSPYTSKSEYLVFLLEDALKKESHTTPAEKQVISVLLGFLQE